MNKTVTNQTRRQKIQQFPDNHPNITTQNCNSVLSTELHLS